MFSFLAKEKAGHPVGSLESSESFLGGKALGEPWPRGAPSLGVFSEWGPSWEWGLPVRPEGLRSARSTARLLPARPWLRSCLSETRTARPWMASGTGTTWSAWRSS